MLKNSGTCVTDVSVKFVNTLFEKGIFPTKWTESIVFPLLRKAMLIIRIITAVSRWAMQAANFTVQLLTLDYKSGLK